MLTTPRRIAAVACGLAMVLGAACTPEGPPVPPPSSSPGSPESSGDKKANDYKAAAETIARANQIVDESIVRGLPAPPEELAELADPDGSYYQRQAQGLKQLHEKGLRYNQASRVAAVFPAPGSTYSHDRLVLYVCYDGRGVAIVDQDGTVVEKGELVETTLVLQRSGDGTPPNWRVWNYADSNNPGANPVDACQETPL